jgi:hypothetical protein
MLLVAAEKSDIYTPMIDTINTMYPTKNQQSIATIPPARNQKRVYKIRRASYTEKTSYCYVIN